MAEKLTQAEIDALVASLLAAENAEKKAAEPKAGQESPAPASPASAAAEQPAQAAPADFASIQDLGPVTQEELDAAVAAARAARQSASGAVAAEIAVTATPAAPAGSSLQSPAPTPAQASAPAGKAGTAPAMRLPPGLRGVLLDIELTLSVELGKARLPLGEILSMGPGSVITLDRMASEPLDVKVNGLPAMKAEVIAIGEKYGIRIVESRLPNYAAAS